ncbi:hypothetical protein AGABI2DRAFT_213298 [Agaricus bisporus var. bisporus H97]|uniref:hypothetical protein n=1 Tax=Agaricus bisporus var. bisporus (strain H97 / ATCC MYA-4626 / FGSC 10389) TaxID=936046 RepID=UPI00029F599B|nr:hypothetical protein AGABI2DRAFT_213298 [Agaricus bisporus var. bisporus H97]EKV50839.1 hypothetical protein AGABI2DRAFT_213298 [Agaricus bisporus var. bisporus H97]
MNMEIRDFEHAYYIGSYLSGILYGLELALYFMIMKKLCKKEAIGNTRMRRFLAVFSTIGLVLFTVDIACNAVWGEIMWINGRELPDGVPEFFDTMVYVWYQTLGSTSVVTMIFLGDGLLLYRLYIIWGSKWKIMVIPIMAYLAAFALAVVQLVLSGKPGGNFFGKETTVYGTPYYVITIGLNIFVTTMIYGRIQWLIGALSGTRVKRSIKSCRLYVSPAGAFIESAALYSIVGILYLVPYATESQTAICFGQIWAKLTFICPQMIILRMASGHAWNRERINEAETTMNGQISSVVFDDV